MPLSSAAELELRTLLRAYRAAHGGVIAPSGSGKALEAWVLMKMAQAASSMRGWTVSLRQGDGTPLPPGATFQLPSQRTRIQPSAPGAPGFVLLERPAQRVTPGERFELHASLQWLGRSGASHECDVSVVPAVIGQAIRNNGGGYPHGLPIAAVECKDKGGAGSLDETRQTLARMYDLVLVTKPASGRACRIFETQAGSYWGRRSSRYVSFFAKGTFAIVRAGTFQGGTAALAAHYHVQRYRSVYTHAPSMTALQDHFKDTLRSTPRF